MFSPRNSKIVVRPVFPHASQVPSKTVETRRSFIFPSEETICSTACLESLVISQGLCIHQNRRFQSIQFTSRECASHPNILTARDGLDSGYSAEVWPAFGPRRTRRIDQKNMTKFWALCIRDGYAFGSPRENPVIRVVEVPRRQDDNIPQSHSS